MNIIIEAIEKAGGSQEVANKLQKIISLGEFEPSIPRNTLISRQRVDWWRKHGLTVRWLKPFSKATGVALTKLVG